MPLLRSQVRPGCNSLNWNRREAKGSSQWLENRSVNSFLGAATLAPLFFSAQSPLLAYSVEKLAFVGDSMKINKWAHSKSLFFLSSVSAGRLEILRMRVFQHNRPEAAIGAYLAHA